MKSNTYCNAATIVVKNIKHLYYENKLFRGSYDSRKKILFLMKCRVDVQKNCKISFNVNGNPLPNENSTNHFNSFDIYCNGTS